MLRTVFKYVSINVLKKLASKLVRMWFLAKCNIFSSMRHQKWRTCEAYVLFDEASASSLAVKASKACLSKSYRRDGKKTQPKNLKTYPRSKHPSWEALTLICQESKLKFIGRIQKETTQGGWWGEGGQTSLIERQLWSTFFWWKSSSIDSISIKPKGKGFMAQSVLSSEKHWWL